MDAQEVVFPKPQRSTPSATETLEQATDHDPVKETGTRTGTPVRTELIPLTHCRIESSSNS